MLSVSSGDSTRRSAGFPFDEWSQTVTDTEELLDASPQRQGGFSFKEIRTTWSIVLLLVVSVAFEITLFVVPHFCQTTCGVPPHSLLLYIHGATWFLYMLTDRYWRYQHYDSRTSGYLEFYRATRHIRRVPILVFSGGTAILLVIATVLEDFCPREDIEPDRCPGVPLSKCNYIQVITSLELGIIVPVLVLYLVKTVKFNRVKAYPDIHQEELIGSFSRSPSMANGLGFRDETFVDEMLEKQADMIRYLKHHNTHLGRKILQLTAEINHQSSVNM